MLEWQLTGCFDVFFPVLASGHKKTDQINIDKSSCSHLATAFLKRLFVESIIEQNLNTTSTEERGFVVSQMQQETLGCGLNKCI